MATSSEITLSMKPAKVDWADDPDDEWTLETHLKKTDLSAPKASDFIPLQLTPADELESTIERIENKPAPSLTPTPEPEEPGPTEESIDAAPEPEKPEPTEEEWYEYQEYLKRQQYIERDVHDARWAQSANIQEDIITLTAEQMREKLIAYRAQEEEDQNEDAASDDTVGTWEMNEDEQEVYNFSDEYEDNLSFSVTRPSTDNEDEIESPDDEEVNVSFSITGPSTTTTISDDEGIGFNDVTFGDEEQVAITIVEACDGRDEGYISSSPPVSPTDDAFSKIEETTDWFATNIGLSTSSLRRQTHVRNESMESLKAFRQAVKDDPDVEEAFEDDVDPSDVDTAEKTQEIGEIDTTENTQELSQVSTDDDGQLWAFEYPKFILIVTPPPEDGIIIKLDYLGNEMIGQGEPIAGFVDATLSSKKAEVEEAEEAKAVETEIIDTTPTAATAEPEIAPKMADTTPFMDLVTLETLSTTKDVSVSTAGAATDGRDPNTIKSAPDASFNLTPRDTSCAPTLLPNGVAGENHPTGLVPNGVLNRSFIFPAGMPKTRAPPKTDTIAITASPPRHRYNTPVIKPAPDTKHMKNKPSTSDYIAGAVSTGWFYMGIVPWTTVGIVVAGVVVGKLVRLVRRR
jgi:hypothetical protein